MDEFSFKKNEELGSVQGLIFLYLCLIWISRIRTQEELKIPLCYPSGGNLLKRQSHIWNFVKHQRWSSSVKTANGINTFTVSAKKLHHRPPTGFQMRIWLEALWMWGMGGLQVYGICSCRLVYKEVIEVRSNYKKSYLWWCWLLRLNPGTQGEHLTSQLSWVAAWLLVARVCPVYLVEERCYFGVIYLLLGRSGAGKGRRVVSWEGGKGVWGKWSGKVGKVGE